MKKVISINSSRIRSRQEIISQIPDLIKAGFHKEASQFSRLLNMASGVIELYNPLTGDTGKYYLSVGGLLGGGCTGSKMVKVAPQTVQDRLIDLCRNDDCDAIRDMFSVTGENPISITMPLNKRGLQLIHFAGSAEMVDLLISLGADPKCVSPSGETPLHTVVSGEAAEALIKAGADIHAQTFGKLVETIPQPNGGVETLYGGNTPLHRARCGDVIKVLLDHGANVEALNNGTERMICNYLLQGKMQTMETPCVLKPFKAIEILFASMVQVGDEDFDSLKSAFLEGINKIVGWHENAELLESFASSIPAAVDKLAKGEGVHMAKLLEFAKYELSLPFQSKDGISYLEKYVKAYDLHHVLLRNYASAEGKAYYYSRAIDTEGYAVISRLI